MSLEKSVAARSVAPKVSGELIRYFCRQIAFMLVCMFAAPLALTSAQAQLQIQIGGSEAEFKAILGSEGYDRIDTHKLGLSSSSFDACKNGKRYRISFEWTGDRDRKVIGDCRIVLDEDQIRKILSDRGYGRITIEDRAGKYIAVGCRGSERLRAELNYYGDISTERRIGQCVRELSPADITAKLESEGYTRISFVDRQPPRYVAEACRESERVKLVIDNFGQILDSTRLGRCSSAISSDQIVRIMEEKGYSRVQLISAQRGRYIAEGCRSGQRFEVTLNRWGDVANEVFLRRCPNAYSEEQIETAMRENGYRNVSVRLEGENYVTRGCRDNRYNEIVLSRYGELVNRRDLGSCEAPKINDLAETLRSRGLSKLKFYVEACEGRARVRITFDEFANRTGRDVVGGC